MRSPPHWLALAVHGALVVLIAALLLMSRLPSPWHAVTAVAAVVPLLLTWPGLVALRRYALQWLSIVLVIYITVTVTEVLVSAARIVPVLALLAAMIELSLVFVLIRQSGRRPSAGPPAASE